MEISKKNIAVITYNYPHRKTQDCIFQLKTKGYKNVHLLALPFVHRENPFKPIFKHRPSHCIDIYPKELAENFAYNFLETQADEIKSFLDKNYIYATLIAGAGLLPKDLVLSHSIINSHPAYLPFSRGLDALKWAIYNMEKVGITSHFINDKADAGLLIEQKIVPIYTNDSFHSFAYRQYQMEIDLLIKSIELIENKNDYKNLSSDSIANKRMTKKIENNLMNYFEKYKEKYAEVSK